MVVARLGFGPAIEAALDEYGGGTVTTVEEPQYAGSNGALKIALDMPEDYWKESRLAPKNPHQKKLLPNKHTALANKKPDALSIRFFCILVL